MGKNETSGQVLSQSHPNLPFQLSLEVDTDDTAFKNIVGSCLNAHTTRGWEMWINDPAIRGAGVNMFSAH